MKVYLICSGNCEEHEVHYVTTDYSYACNLLKKLKLLKTNQREAWKKSDDLCERELVLYEANLYDGKFTGRVHGYLCIEEHELMEEPAGNA